MVTCPAQGTFRSPVADGTRAGSRCGGATPERVSGGAGAEAGGGGSRKGGARVYLQWWARSGLMLQHLGHLYTTCPGFSCKLSMNSLVAFPLGTAPCQKEERRQAWAGVPAALTLHGGDGHLEAATAHTDRTFSPQRHMWSGLGQHRWTLTDKEFS